MHFNSKLAYAVSCMRGLKTYIFATFMTAVAGYGMYTGKLDYNAGIGIISTMGIGACLRSGVNTQAPANLDPAPPCPNCLSDANKGAQ